MPGLQLETFLPYHHPTVRPRTFLDLRRLRTISNHGDGLWKDQGERALLCWRFHVATDEPSRRLYCVSGCVVPSCVLCVLNIFSDKTRRRGMMVSIALAIYLAFAVRITFPIVSRPYFRLWNVSDLGFYLPDREPRSNHDQ